MYLEICQEDRSYVKCSYHTHTNCVRKEEEEGKRGGEAQTLGGDGCLYTQMAMMAPWVFVYPKLIKLCMLMFNAQLFVKQTSTKWFGEKTENTLS